MFKPKKMTRVIIIGPKMNLKHTISELYALKLIHIIDFADPNKEFTRGQPLESASEISDSLVKLRSMSSALRLEDELKKMDVDEESGEDGNLREKILTLELNMNEDRFAKKEIEDALLDTRTKIEIYRSFAALGLPFEYYFGYKKITVFTGILKHTIDGIEKLTGDYELVSQNNVMALFVPSNEKEKIEAYLNERGFIPLEPPEKQGDPAEKLSELESYAKRLEGKLKEVNERLERLKKKHARFIIQAERRLAIEVEKAEIPITFASTEHSFIVDGWIPRESYPKLKERLCELEGLYVDEVESEHREPPVLLDNPRPAKPFEMLVHLYATPSYGEIDPTIILSFIFPIFFGFMIGDAGFGILMMGMGYYMSKKMWKAMNMPSFREMGQILFMGGVFSIIFGLFMFSEFFAIPFHSATEAKIDVGNWSDYLGIDIHLYPLVHKIEDIKDLLVISILAAWIHLSIGYIIGIINELRHSRKHAIAKLGWLAILFAIFLEIMVVVEGTKVGGFLVNTFFPYAPGFVLNFGRIPISTISMFMMGAGVAMFFPAEGAMAIPEVVGLASNVLSYVRLAGIAVAKAAIAMGVTKILILVLHSENTMFVIMGGFLVLLLYAMVFILGMIAAGIQALRLNYVEFFRKFYEGNGSLFQPFGTSKKAGD